MKFLGGCILIFLAVMLCFMGVQAIPHGAVAGGNLIWVLFFGGSVLLGGAGVSILIKQFKSN